MAGHLLEGHGDMWKFVGESVVGTSHSATAAPCQDASKIVSHTSTSGTLIAVCGDGAGTAIYADVGAQMACRTITELCELHLSTHGPPSTISQKHVENWLATLKSRLDDEASLLGVSRRELATTLLVALLGDDDSCFFQLGDGAMVIGNTSTYETIFWPQSGEYVNTTMFVTDDNAQSNVQFVFRPGRIDRFAAFTDGLERLVLKFSDRTVHQPFFDRMFDGMQSSSMEKLSTDLRHFLESEAVNSRTDDDKTLILACRISGVAHGSTTL